MKKYDPNETKWWLIITFVFVFIILYLYFLGFITKVHGMEIEPKVSLGYIHLDEHGNREGNKPMVGVSVSFSGGDKVYGSVTPEFWQSSGSSDKEVPERGFGLHSQLGYRLIKSKDAEVTPVLGLYTVRFDRQANEKWVGQKSWGYSSWSTMTLLGPTTGVNLQYKYFYGKINLFWPMYFDADTDNPSNHKFQPHEPHEFVELGVTYQDVSLGVFRRKLSVDQMENNVYLSGLTFGYKF